MKRGEGGRPDEVDHLLSVRGTKRYRQLVSADPLLQRCLKPAYRQTPRCQSIHRPLRGAFFIEGAAAGARLSRLMSGEMANSALDVIAAHFHPSASRATH